MFRFVAGALLLALYFTFPSRAVAGEFRVIPYPVHLNDSNRPLVVLTHGIDADAEQLKPLAETLDRRGYRTIIIQYDYRDPLELSARRFLEALIELTRQSSGPLRVIAHSMGGLVVRNALTHADQLPGKVPVLFVSIASPFGGFSSANDARGVFAQTIGRLFGVLPSYADLGTEAKFIVSPGTLPPQVTHFKVETMEKDQGGDSKLSCLNQENPIVDESAKWIVAIASGHAASIDRDGEPSSALVARLAQLGFPDLGSGPEAIAPVPSEPSSRCRDLEKTPTRI